MSLATVALTVACVPAVMGVEGVCTNETVGEETMVMVATVG
jgi:hypothetical protein